MKLMKFLPAAVAALVLASCSTEEFDSSKVQQNAANKGDLRIVWDTIDDDVPTRALSNNLFGGPYFEDQDQIFVYDEKMHSSDIYAFKEDGFYFDAQFEGDQPIIEGEPSYAVYAGKFWDFEEEEEVTKAPKGYVLRTEEGTPTCVDIKLPRVLRYKETADGYGYEIPSFGKAGYHGEVGAEGTYLEATNFRALTARLRIRLDNAFANVSYLKLSNTAKKPLSGTLTAKLFTGDKRTKSMLQIVDKDYVTYPDIYIDLRNVPSNKSYIYIPVVSGSDYDHLLNGDTDGITLKYISDRTVEDPTTVPAASWTDTGMKFPGEVFSPNSRHAGSYSYELTDMNPKKVSDILAQYSTSGNDIELNLTKQFTIKAGDPTIDNVVYLPKFDKENMVVRINLVAPFTAFTNEANDPLIVKNVDDAEPTNAKVILNLGTITPVAGKMNLEIDAPGADLQVIGDFSGQTSLKLANADKFTIGDGENATDFKGLTTIDWGAEGAGVKEIVIEDKAEVNATADDVSLNKTINEKLTVNGKLDATGQTINVGGSTEEVVVGPNGEIKANLLGGTNSKVLEKIEIAGKVEAQVKTAKDFATAVTVKGEGLVSGNITVQNVASNLTIQDKAQVVGNIDATAVIQGALTITSETDKAVTGNVTIGGNVNVAMTAEGEAITGTLEMQGSNKTLKLVQGYINTVKADVKNTGKWEDMFITVKLDDLNEGLAAIGKLQKATDNEIKFTKSLWNGEFMDASYKATYRRTNESANLIYTATQLASATGIALSNIKLMNDFDLNNKATWKGIKSSASNFKVIGNDKKIEKLAFDAKNAKGLINTIEGGEISDLTIEGVTVTNTATAAVAGVGALVGTATDNALTIKNVKITGVAIDLGSDYANSNVGGVIGSSAKALTLTGVEAAGTIDAYSALGGLVGKADAAVTASDCKANVTFKQTYNSKKTFDMKYASVGNFIGTVTGNVTITNGTIPSSINFDKSDRMFCSDATVTDGDMYTYVANPNQLYVGFSGNANSTTLWTIGTLTVDGNNKYEKLGFADPHANVDSYTELDGTHYPIYKWAKKTISARKR